MELGADSRRSEPLLGRDRRVPPDSTVSAGGSCTADALPVAALAALHVFSGAIERVLFARLAASMPHSVLLMHTLLAGLSALLFGVLRLARSQSSQAPVSEALQRVRPSDVVLMALLDTMHSLLALDGATQLPGTTQTLLLQATLPATVFLSALALRARYGWAQLAGALLLALAVAALLLPASEAEQQQQQEQHHHHQPAVAAPQHLPLREVLFGEPRLPATRLPMQSQWPQAPPPQSPPPQQLGAAVGGPLVSRLAFAAGALFAAASAVFKKRQLSRAPLDMLLLAGWCAAAQLAGGLVVAPPLLLALHGVTARQTLYDLLRALRCVTSGLSALSCDEMPEARQAPFLLIFFLVSSCWSALSLLLLARGGERCGERLLSLGSALLLPAALFAFVRPVALPYAWEAPPEALPAREQQAAIAMIAALALYQGGSLWRARTS